MKRVIFARIVIIGLATVLASCGDNSPTSKSPPAPQKSGPNVSKLPDVGGVELVSVTASGSGTTPGGAVNDAIKNAIVQTNGTRMQSSSNQVNFALQIASDKDSAALKGSAFAEQIVSQSKGAISEFKVDEVKGPGRDALYSATINAKVAKFKAPGDAGKIKIVVSAIRTNSKSFDVGGTSASAEQVVAGIRQQVIDALTQTGRFSILDREFSEDIQNELNLIASNQSRNIDYAKLGQAVSADLVWVGNINSLAYTKHVRRLQTSDRELVSYSGGWSFSQRLINVGTRQIMGSETLEGQAPGIAPTTLGTSVDTAKMLAAMQGSLARAAVDAILQRTFPVSVVSLEGNTVVLSQGGKSLIERARYDVVILGAELKDPQTGQSLGNRESPCCAVVIDKVTPTLSYGTLENVTSKLDGLAPGVLQVRGQIKASPQPPPDAEKTGSSTTPAPGKNKTKQDGVGAETEPVAKPKDKEW